MRQEKGRLMNNRPKFSALKGRERLKSLSEINFSCAMCWRCDARHTRQKKPTAIAAG